MKITRFGHSCLLIEAGQAKLLLDPGIFSVVPDLEGIDAILISHEHPDHWDTDTLKKLTAKNPSATIYTNSGVGKLLAEQNISYSEIAEGQTLNIKNVPVEVCGHEHATIYSSFPPCINSGFFINNDLFFPGDSFFIPSKPVKTLALPAGAPWLKVSEAIDYALKIKPNIAFPIHDAMFKDLNFAHRWFEIVLPGTGIDYKAVKDNENLET